MNIRYLFARLFSRLNPSAISNTTRHPTSKFGPGSQIVNCKVGRYSYCGERCTILHTNIGAFTSIADGVAIGGVKHDFSLGATSKVFQKGKNPFGVAFSEFPAHPFVDTEIGNDVFIGKSVSVGSGLKVGTGAIIGMGSIVTKDVPPYAIAAGVPAKVVAYRFPPDIIEALLSSEWWDLPDEKVREVAQHLEDPLEMVRVAK